MRSLVNLAGKTALVTGGSKRLGRAICEALAREGVHVAVHFNQSEREARDLAKKLRDGGVQAWTVQGDLAKPGAAAGLYERAHAAAGPIDFLVNNASIFPEQTFEHMSAAEVHENIDLNALSPAFLSRAFAAQNRDGAIINLLDSRAFDKDPRHLPYHLSKRMLHSLTRIMALEFAPRIRVNAVAPGLVLPPEGKSVEYLEGLRDTNPLKDYGDSTGVAEAVIFLLRSDFVTGQTLFVDGGRHLYGSTY